MQPTQPPSSPHTYIQSQSPTEQPYHIAAHQSIPLQHQLTQQQVQAQGQQQQQSAGQQQALFIPFYSISGLYREQIKMDEKKINDLFKKVQSFINNIKIYNN